MKWGRGGRVVAWLRRELSVIPFFSSSFTYVSWCVHLSPCVCVCVPFKAFIVIFMFAWSYAIFLDSFQQTPIQPELSLLFHVWQYTTHKSKEKFSLSNRLKYQYKLVRHGTQCEEKRESGERKITCTYIFEMWSCLWRACTIGRERKTIFIPFSLRDNIKKHHEQQQYQGKQSIESNTSTTTVTIWAIARKKYL